MRKYFNELTLQRFNTLAFPLVFLWSLSLCATMFLPSSTHERFNSQFEPFFEIFHFGERFALNENGSSASHSKTETITTLVPYPHKLKGLYRADTGSYASIYDGKETTIVPLKGVYKGVFHLIGLNNRVAIFKGYGKNYPLRLGEDDNLSRLQKVTRLVVDPIDEISKGKQTLSIPYESVMKQVNELHTIHKSIDISESKNGSKFMGYRINAIATDSLFSQLGLQKGDVINSINNHKLESFGDVLMIYARLPQLRSIRLSVLRNNHQKEIVYEIIR
jgi:type II secretion system protein C